MQCLLHRRTRSNWLFFPKKKWAPLQYNLGSLKHSSFAESAIRWETSCGNKPWGINPLQKLNMRQQGSLSCGVNFQSSRFDTRSCAGTKYLISLLLEWWWWNLARKPNFSIMSRTLCRSASFPLPCKSSNTLFISCIWRTPVSSSFCHNLRSTGSLQTKRTMVNN